MRCDEILRIGYADRYGQDKPRREHRYRNGHDEFLGAPPSEMRNMES